ncbi:MAG: sensor histidine kinase, partial [Vulcanimicrobiota bacterium]
LRGYFNLVKEDPRLLGTNYPRIVNSLDRLNTYVNTLLEFSSAGEIERDAKLNLDSFLNNVLSKINTENADVRVQVEPDLEIMASAHSLEQAFTLLFKNTLSRAPESGKVSLIIAGRREDDRIIIQITDNGKQMHLKKPEDIFSLCASLKSEKHLTGLPVCSRIIEAHEGTIKMISLRKRRLTQFLITFPA